MKKGIFAICFIAALLSGCFEKELTADEIALVSNLKIELAETKKSIDQSQAQDALYSGGLVKGLIAVRLEVLKTNEALLQQRIHAIEGRAPVKINTFVIEENSVLAEELSKEIEQAQSDLLIAETEASAYSGGLVGAMKAAAVATQKNTIAMLKQRYLSAKYGLLSPTLAKGADTPAPQKKAASSSTSEGSLSVTPEAKLAPPKQGPFGLEKGVTISDIEAMVGTSLSVANENQNLYIISSAPKGNPEFESYLLMISPTIGLCQIRAIGKSVTTNRFGHQIKSNFEGLQASLKSVYGAPKTLDQLLYGSIWKDSSDWMMSLYKKERYLISEWSSSEAAPLSNDIESVNLEARATGSSSAFLYLQYSFNNLSTCNEEIEAGKLDSL